MQPLEQRKRDPFFTDAAYEGCLEEAEAILHGSKFVEDRSVIKANFDDKGARQVSFARVRYLIENVWACYSAGDPITDMRERVQYVFEDLQRHKDAFPDKSFKLWEADSYYFTLLLMSWAVLFNLPEKMVTLDMYTSKEQNDGEDPLMYMFFSNLGIKNFSGKNAELLHPSPYAILYDALRKNDKTAQQKAMVEYLKKWYKGKAIKACYWHNLHSANPPMHLGYWAFETGMITVLNGLDDSSYRHLNFYPRDLVDYGKEQGWHEELREKLQG